MKHQLLYCLCIILVGCSATPEVGKFSIYEKEFDNINQFENPYFDVDLEVEVESPEGIKVKHYGFYDGDETWKFRFMPDKTGIWKYAANFSDGTKAGSGKFICIESEKKGPLMALPENPIWFATKNGEPFLMRSFHVGDRFFAENWTDSTGNNSEPRKQFLNWLEENNYNTLSIASFLTNRQTEGRGLGWDTPEMWPLNYKEYQKAEAILNELSEREIYIFPFAGFFGRDGAWPTNHNEQEKYIKYVLARFGAYSNLLFNVAGPEPLFGGRPEHKAGYKNQMEVKDLDRLANTIQKYDVFKHLITVHNQTTASRNGDPFINFNWCGFSTIQGPKTKNLKQHQSTVFNIRHPGKPYFAQETLWGGNMYHPDYGLEYIRKIGIVLTMSAAMINFADNNGNSSSGFSGSLDFKDCKQKEHDVLKQMWDFFETVPFGQMKPDTIVAPSKFVLSGKNQILIYAEKQDSFRVHLGENKIYSAKWINAQNTREIIGAENLRSGNTVKTPAHGDDWFLQLTVQ